MGDLIKNLENVGNACDQISEVLNWTKKSLSLLEGETRINFFKKAGDWIKKVFWSRWKINQSTNEWESKTGNIQPSKEWKSTTTNSKFEQNKNTNGLKVFETRNYIINWGTFKSPSKWICKRDKYRHVCSTGSFNVLRRLWLPKVSESTEVDLTWNTLTRMWLSYIGEVNPKDPWKNWYKPQDWDTAVWPRFTRTVGKNAWKTTQHQATYINWHWVSDNIQNQMSCYMKEPNEPNCKIYRYMA